MSSTCRPVVGSSATSFAVIVDLYQTGLYAGLK